MSADVTPTALETARIAVIIPARNEAASIAQAITAIPQWVDEIIVVDNGSDDATAALARQAGASVIAEPRPGYGHACWTGAGAASAELLVFMDGDCADDPADMPAVLAPLINGAADLVIGSRTLGTAQAGALTPQQRWGNRLACTLIRRLWGHAYTDLGPFRAIRQAQLMALAPRQMTFGWTVEMQIRALKCGLRVQEVPVGYRCRIGQSKISGTVGGTLKAGYGILACIGREALRGPAARPLGKGSR